MLINKLLKHRDAVAISMVMCSGPLNYALRDGLGLAPGSTAFTLIFFFGGIFLALPFRNFSTFYKHDTPLSFLALCYLLMSVLYMMVYLENKYLPISQKIYDSVIISLTVYFLFFLSTVSEKSLRLNFLRYSVCISFLGCAGLIAWVAMNPNYIIGQRLTISFAGNSEAASMGNPHIYGRGAFFGMVASLIYLKYERSRSLRTLTYIGLVVFVAVLLTAQAMSAIIAGMIVISLFFWNNTSLAKVLKFIRFLFTKWYVWLILIAVIVKSINFIAENRAIVDVTIELITGRVEKIANTFTSNADDSKITPKADVSAMSRLELLQQVREDHVNFFLDGQYHKLLFGQGYFSLYVDVPVVEVYNSFGLVGLLIFGTFFFLMLKYCLREMRAPSSIMSEFVAYGFIYFFIITFTNGLILEYQRWTFFILVCRFMPAAKEHIKKMHNNTKSVQYID